MTLEETFSGYPPVVVVDTNVLLTAAFLPGHTADDALRFASMAKLSLVIDRAIADEATRILHSALQRTRLEFDAVGFLWRYLETRGIDVIGSEKSPKISGINGSDQHVAGLAMRLGAWVLTSDVNFIAECYRASIPAQQPINFLRYLRLAVGAGPDIGHILRVGGPLSRDQGFIFSAVTAEWFGQIPQMQSIHVVADLQGVGRLEYRCRDRQWAFVTQMGATAVLPCDLSTAGAWRICASYRFAPGSQQGNATLRCAVFANAPVNGSKSVDVHLPHRSTAEAPGMINLGHDAQGTSNWPGHFIEFFVGATSMSSKNWKAVLRVPHATPDPAYENALDQSLIETARSQAEGRPFSIERLSAQWLELRC